MDNRLEQIRSVLDEKKADKIRVEEQLRALGEQAEEMGVPLDKIEETITTLEDDYKKADDEFMAGVEALENELKQRGWRG